MTTAEMLASLEAQIRKDIPRLMELKEGCKVLSYKKIKNIVSNKNNCLIAVDCLNGGIGFLDHKSFEIIGHDIMLNDVLEWLNIKNKNITIYSDGTLFDLNHLVYYNEMSVYGYNNLNWNLLSPYLKDQGEEFINFLYELIK